jgi:hypothetical protein
MQMCFRRQLPAFGVSPELQNSPGSPMLFLEDAAKVVLANLQEELSSSSKQSTVTPALTIDESGSSCQSTKNCKTCADDSDMEILLQEVKGYVARLAGEFSCLTEGFEKLNRHVAKTTEIKETKDKQLSDIASTVPLSPDQGKYVQKITSGTLQGSDIYWDLLQASNRQQAELLATMGEVKQMLGVSARNEMTEKRPLTPQRSSLPVKDTCFEMHTPLTPDLRGSPACCSEGPQVRVMKLPPNRAAPVVPSQAL